MARRAALGVLLTATIFTGCKKATVEDATMFSGDTKTLRALVEKGEDLNTRNNSGDTPLILAISNKNDAVADFFMDNHADLEAKDKNGWTALVWAVQTGNLRMTQRLVADGAEVNARDRNQKTPLMWAAAGGFVEAVELLLKNGADPNAADDYLMTPMKYATVGFTDVAHRQIEKMLGKSGAN